jgi:hypothetical protein
LLIFSFSSLGILAIAPLRAASCSGCNYEVQQDNNGSSASATQDTVSKQCRTRGLRPFVKGDPRINRKGRPKSFDQFRELAQAIGHEKITDKDGELMMRVEAILRSWTTSKQPVLQLAFIAYCYGKPPDKIETESLQPGTVLRLHFANELGEPLDGPFPAFPDLPPNLARIAQRRLEKGPERPATN